MKHHSIATGSMSSGGEEQAKPAASLDPLASGSPPDDVQLLLDHANNENANQTKPHPTNDIKMNPSFVSNHALMSTTPGESEVENVTRAIEQRRANRVVVTHDIQVTLIEICRDVAKRQNYPVLSKIHKADLVQLRNTIVQKDEDESQKPWRKILNALGFRSENEQLHRVLDRALEVVEDIQAGDDDDFHYMDFNEYYTVVESQWPWMRSGVFTACFYVFLFYAFTPIFFCAIIGDEGVCPDYEEGNHHRWLGALYFASTTLSTVGYGDLTVEKDKVGHVFAGCVYMILANITLIGSFSVVAGNSWNPVQEWHEKIIDWMVGPPNHDEPMHKKLRRVRFMRLTELIGGFIVLNLIGVFANRLFLLAIEDGELETDWNWMISFYWAIQTTTTIGYGDLDQPISQRWFQIFYLVLSTYFVGNALGGLADLNNELESIRMEEAWERRGVSKNLIEELQPEEHDGKIDQYEFLVASLVQLGKLSSDDVIPIMDKFRSLASEDGFIVAKDTKEDATAEQIQEAIDTATKQNNPLGMLADAAKNAVPNRTRQELVESVSKRGSVGSTP